MAGAQGEVGGGVAVSGKGEDSENTGLGQASRGL